MENRLLDAICAGRAGTEIITIPEEIADVIFDKKECAFGRESELAQAEPEALCCDGRATSSLSSSFLNCSDVTERVVLIQTAQGGTVKLTTHVCLKTYFEEGSNWRTETNYDQNIYRQESQA